MLVQTGPAEQYKVMSSQLVSHFGDDARGGDVKRAGSMKRGEKQQGRTPKLKYGRPSRAEERIEQPFPRELQHSQRLRHPN